MSKIRDPPPYYISGIQDPTSTPILPQASQGTTYWKVIVSSRCNTWRYTRSLSTYIPWAVIHTMSLPLESPLHLEKVIPSFVDGTDSLLPRENKTWNPHSSLEALITLFIEWADSLPPQESKLDRRRILSHMAISYSPLLMKVTQVLRGNQSISMAPLTLGI